MKTLVKKLQVANLQVVVESVNNKDDKLGLWAIFDENGKEDIKNEFGVYITASIYSDNNRLLYQGRGKNEREAVNNLFDELRAAALTRLE
jgi:hypothetical protein